MVTRLHSSRMRTAHALTVSPSILWGGGGGVCSGGGGGLLSAPGRGVCSRGVCSWGVCAPGGVCSGGGGGIPTCTEADPPPLWTESQMPVKTLHCPNFVVGGN